MSTDSAPKAGRILFICGSMNQTTQMHQIAEQLPEYDHRFTPYYHDGWLDYFRRRGMIEFTILGNKIADRVIRYCENNDLVLDFHGEEGGYDLVVTCADLIIPKNIREYPIVLVQEGMTDPERWIFHLLKAFRFLPRWLGSTQMMGLSGRYERFCIASKGYRGLFTRKGAPADRLTVTGIPNFDNCAKHLENTFPHRDYLLVCTSDMRETYMPENRKKFIERAVSIANGRQIIFKLHPNEDWDRAATEVNRFAPGSFVYTEGNTDEMIANCHSFLTHYSSTVYVALALGKEVHCDLDVEELRKLLPIQNGCAASNIANVCREVILETQAATQREISYSLARNPLLWARAWYRSFRTS